MHKTTALCLALTAATSCKTETVTLGVKKDNAKKHAVSHDTEPIVFEDPSGPTITPSVPIANQGVATPEIKSLSIIHDKERQPRHAAAPQKRATKALLSDTKAAIQQAIEQIEQGDRNIQKELANAQTALKRTGEQRDKIIQVLANEQKELQRTGEQRDRTIQALANVQTALKRTSEERDRTIQALTNVQAALKRTSEEKDKNIQMLNNEQKELQRTGE